MCLICLALILFGFNVGISLILSGLLLRLHLVPQLELVRVRVRYQTPPSTAVRIS